MYGTIVVSPSYHRVFTIVPSCIAGNDEIKSYDCPNGTPCICNGIRMCFKWRIRSNLFQGNRKLLIIVQLLCYSCKEIW